MFKDKMKTASNYNDNNNNKNLFGLKTLLSEK